MVDRLERMPDNLLLVRHGKSEANVLQEAQDEGWADQLPLALRTRPDWQHRLSSVGVGEARAAGKWILHNFMPVHDIEGRYCSYFIRARETADELEPGLSWRPHNMIHEQDWGEFGMVSPEEQAARFGFTQRMREVAPLFARFDGGESAADSVTLRAREFRSTLRYKWSDKNVIAVVHGGYANVMRYMLERWLPEDWDAAREDKTQKIKNGMILWYSKVNPEDPTDRRDHLNWRRMINPWDLAASPYGGEWCELPDRRFLGGAALRDSIEAIPRLLPD